MSAALEINALLDHLQSMRQPILKALLESATVATFDGTTLELAFPPDKKFGVTKVIDRGDELRDALGSLFGIRPEIRCVVRQTGITARTFFRSRSSTEMVPGPTLAV